MTNTIKTPAQITEQIKADYADLTADDLGYSVGEMMIAAIEADRAQRADALNIILDAAANWADELTGYIIPLADGNEVPGLEAEHDALCVAIDQGREAQA